MVIRCLLESEKGTGMNEREYLNAVLDEIVEKIIDYHEIGCNLKYAECKMVACIEPKDVIADLEIINEYRKEQE